METGHSFSADYDFATVSPVSLSVAILTLRAVPTPRTPSHMSKMEASVTPKSRWDEIVVSHVSG